jgi:Dolichyl-phosphate-mannose-protein mannosyltransferase
VDDRGHFLELALLAAVWTVAIAIIHPRGNFPIVDDWDFAIATWNFARTGHFQFTNFTAVSLRAMVLWGALWTRLFGQSFEVLRASTLTLSMSTILIVNRTLVHAGIVRGLRLLASLALLFHPLFLWASCTYMTDVPFLFASSIAVYAFVRALQQARYGWFLAGCVAVITAWFIRQNGVVLLLPPLILLTWHRERLTPRWRAFAATIGVVLAFFAVLLAFKRDWLAGSPAMFATHFHVWTESTYRLPDQISALFRYVLFNAQNSAMFFLPLTLPLIACLRGLRRRDAILLAAISVVVAWRAIDLGLAGYLVPYDSAHLYSDILPGNLFINFGVGVPMLYDTFGLHLPYPFGLSAGARAVLTGMSALVTALLLWALILPERRSLFFQLAALMAAIGTLALFGSGYYYDRYSLDSAWTCCLVLPIVVPWERRSARVLAAVALAAIAAFSTLSVQEHFVWQRARWTAWNDLRGQGIDISQIDGGGEATGFYELANAPVAEARRPHPQRPYVIAFRPLDGFRVVARYPFTSFLGMRSGEIVVLKHASP